MVYIVNGVFSESCQNDKVGYYTINNEYPTLNSIKFDVCMHLLVRRYIIGGLTILKHQIF